MFEGKKKLKLTFMSATRNCLPCIYLRTLCVLLVFDTSMNGVVAGGGGTMTTTTNEFSGKTFPGLKQSQ